MPIPSASISTYKDVTFDEEDTALLKLNTDLLLKAKALQFSILPKMDVVLKEALSRVRKIYGNEVFNEDSITYSYPNFRENREHELKHDYDTAAMGITGARKPIWKGFERKDGKPVKIMSYALFFILSEEGLSLNFGRWFRPKLSGDSLKKFLEFIRQNYHLVQAIQQRSRMEPLFQFLEEEDQAAFPLSKYIDRLIGLKQFDLEFCTGVGLPISPYELNALINSFVFFYPIYDSVLRIAKGERDVFEDLTARFKIKDYLEYLEYDDADTGGENDDRPKPSLTEDEENLLARSVDGKKVVKAGMRWQVMERDDFKCVACGASSKEGKILHIDHIIPRSKGGLDVLDNYQTLCQTCNIGKSNKSQLDLRNKELK